MNYPALVLRIRAMCLDAIVFVLLFWIVLLLIWKLQFSSTYLKVIVVAIPLILFEPLWMWMTGSTIGQHIVGIRVANIRTERNLFILPAIVRFIVKILLGFYSVITMIVTKRRQSFHDVISNSVVLFKNESTAPDRYKIQENTTDVMSKPSIIRRILVTLMYLFLLLLTFSVTTVVIAPEQCWNGISCTKSQELGVLITSGVFLGLCLLVIILGCLCKLPGAYFKKHNVAVPS